MPQYIGFSTINANKPKNNNPQPGLNGAPGSNTDSISPGRKYRLTDEAIVIRDFLNAINIPQGQKVGKPEYGTTLWSFVFEPNTADTQQKLQDEIRRVVSQDPRLKIGYMKVYPQENGIQLEMQLAVTPFNQARLINVFFNSKTSTAALTS